MLSAQKSISKICNKTILKKIIGTSPLKAVSLQYGKKIFI